MARQTILEFLSFTYIKRYSYPLTMQVRVAGTKLEIFMVNNSKAFRLTRYAIMFATIFVAMMLDRVISLGLPVSTAAVVILITFSFCFLDNSWASGILSFTLFGLASFIKEFIWPSSIAAFPVYEWPLVTIVPRLASGAVAFGIYRLLLLATRKMKNIYVRQTLAMTVAIFIGNATNTVLFLSTLNLFKVINNIDYTSLIVTIKAVIVTNIVPEYLISMILAPHVILGVRRGLKLGIEGNNWRLAKQEEEQAEQQRIEGETVQLLDGDSVVNLESTEWEVVDLETNELPQTFTDVTQTEEDEK